VVWARSATRDLEAISDFISRDNPVAASRVTERIVALSRSLTEHPYLGRVGQAAGTRELVVTRTPYVIVYRLRGDFVEIVAVMHGARRWPSRF
jgi:toxin ParE1/3/4